MFRSIISSSRIKLFSSAGRPVTSGGSSTRRGSTEGTCTIAKSGRRPPFFFFSSMRISGFTCSFFRISAAIFKVLFRISGKGREESTAIGVSTG